ncbi:HNH endonuclease signature motif containing protein [Pseudomonas protegens]|uniref:HNH endonuclease signature motif containing protein n=1 Tax=Pseudomonas protegens TaxID=380021 RepID=UPI00274FEF78|nr:HNH endonuclease signature motif containing protein [Pseudomonas protegens]MDP9514786.1 HNH endonuclease signature motif containing protein [Pseudomonas protegens]
MWTLPLPDVEGAAEDLFTALRENDVRALTSTNIEHDRVLELYRHYDSIGGQPDASLKGEDLRAELLSAIHDSYELTQKNRRLKKIREKLKLNIERCPYCGFGEVTELDHHIPKTNFKAHAIYTRNLIPCCHACNNIKGTTSEIQAEKQFFHAYLGQIPSEAFLKATILMTQLGFTASFSIERTQQLNEDEFKRLTFQLNKLNLNERYTATVATFLSTHKTAIEMMGAVGSEKLREFLLISYEDSCKTFGANHWQSALLLALKESDEFCSGGYRCAFGNRDLPI